MEAFCRKTLVLLPLLFGIHSPVRAEYRAFLLELRNEKKELIRTIPSNLDPEQYLAFHSFPTTHQLSYVDTWMCPGRTGSFQPICPNPKRTPASDPSPQK